MNVKKLLTKLTLLTALSSGLLTGISTISTVSAKDISDTDIQTIPLATNKDYTKMQNLSKKPGIHYVKQRKWFENWVPGNWVPGYLSTKTLKPYDNALMNPGREYTPIIGATNIKGNRYLIMRNWGDTFKFYVPAAFYHIPYGYKFKPNHQPVKVYEGSLAGAENGYSEWLGQYNVTLTKVNTVYSNRADGTHTLTTKNFGLNHGSYNFLIGKIAIRMNDGHDYYPVYTHTPSDCLRVLYMRTEDLDQFEPATVKFDHCGTITANHKYIPFKHKMDDNGES